MSNPELAPDHRVLTVRQVNEEIAAAITKSFPATVWVRGEVQRFPQDAARRTHLYFELHETGASGAAEYQIPVSLMGWDRQRYGLGRFLDGSDPDFRIANQMEVCLECRVDYYAKFGKLTLKVVGVDKTFALGRLEAQRRQTLAYLREAGLLQRNGSVPLPELPLRVGLITAPDSAAAHDFRTGLSASPWAFQVHFIPAKMQGAQLQTEVTAALAAHEAAGVDVIVITRGGGSRADLSWFDQQSLAVAIACCPVPVITAIGHEIDHSIADDVAHYSCKTPTAVAEYLVDRVDCVATRLNLATDQLLARVAEILSVAERRVGREDDLARVATGAVLRARLQYQQVAGRLHLVVGRSLAARDRRLSDLQARLGGVAATHLARGEGRLGELTRHVASAATSSVAAVRGALQNQERRLAREAVRPLAPWDNRLVQYATQTRLLDPRRLLERGYTITLGPDGITTSSAAELAAGDQLTTVFVDGKVNSIVQPGPGTGPTSQRKGARRGGKKDEANPGQKTLFQ